MSFIEEYDQPGGEANHVFQLSKITALYLEHLLTLGGSTSERVHSTQPANRLQRHVPALKVHQSKAGAALTCKKNVGNVIVSACHIAPEVEAIVLMKAAKLIRKKILQAKYHFNGSLCDEQYNHIPASLNALVEMILNGSFKQNINDCEVSD